MKDVYSNTKTIKAVGYLEKNDDGDYIVEVYEKKDEAPTIVMVDELLADMEGLRVSIVAEQEL